MAYDEGPAQRVREVLDDRSDGTEKQMFGGVAFMVGRNTRAGIVGEELIQCVARGVTFTGALPPQ